MRYMALSDVLYSRHFQLDCFNSALLDAVNQVIDASSANIVTNKAESGKFYSSLRPIGHLLYEAKVGVQVERVPPALMAAIQGADPNAAFGWSVISSRGFVFAVQLSSSCGILLTAAVNNAIGVVLDGA